MAIDDRDGRVTEGLLGALADYRRAEAVVRASDEALRKHRTAEIEAAALRASEELLRCRVYLFDLMTRRGWEANDARVAQLERDALLAEAPDGSVPG